MRDRSYNAIIMVVGWLVGWLVAAIYRCFFLLICGNLFFCAEILECNVV
jgi:hypothetical protein